MPMKIISTLIFVVKNFCNKLVIDRLPDEESGNEDLIEEDCFACCPSEQSVRLILDYARACDVIKTQTAGFVELNLN